MQPETSTFTIEDRINLMGLIHVVKELKDDLKEIKDSFKEDPAASHSDLKELESRVRQLENFRWWILGMGIIGGLFVHIFLDKVKF